MRAKLIDVLGVGQEHALLTLEVAERLGIDWRTVQQELRRDRRAGLPIIAGHYGLYLASSPAELARYAKRLKGRANDIWATADRMDKAATAFMVFGDYDKFLHDRKAPQRG